MAFLISLIDVYSWIAKVFKLTRNRKKLGNQLIQLIADPVVSGQPQKITYN